MILRVAINSQTFKHQSSPLLLWAPTWSAFRADSGPSVLLLEDPLVHILRVLVCTVAVLKF